MKISLKDIKFDEQGLVPAVVQDARTSQLLTLAYMNADSLKRTIKSNETWFWSRSRSQLWHKGEISGNTQHVVAISADCDRDALLVEVNPTGPACHTGAQSCFHNELRSEPNGPGGQGTPRKDLGAALADLYSVIETRQRERPEGSYTAYLFDEGLDKILKKVGEEATETIIAAKDEDIEPLISEAADLIYHLLVLLVQRGVSLDQVFSELSSRSTKAGGE
jgi:phosphoribosyl-ATP pyrophosphohydrolase/phosphoribosyl-AMP cyclohydrolase